MSALLCSDKQVAANSELLGYGTDWIRSLGNFSGSAFHD